MSNQLMKIDFNSLSVEEIGYLQDKLMTARVKNIEDSLKRLAEIQSIEIEERKIETQRLDEEIEKTKGMAEAHLRAKQIKYGRGRSGSFKSSIVDVLEGIVPRVKCAGGQRNPGKVEVMEVLFNK